MANKDFLTHNQQMRKLRSNKGIICNGSADKEILCRVGYFNLINGYKAPFVEHTDSESGTHTYYKDTNIKELFALKRFDDELRSLLLKQITQVEEEVRTLTAYKFDEINNLGQMPWYQIDAYDSRHGSAPIMKVIASAFREVQQSSQEYVKYYLEHHKFIPTWIMIKVINFSTFIAMLTCSKESVKKSICTMYGMLDGDGRCDFELLTGSLHWFRMVRNSCAHNERIYTMKQLGNRIKTPYFDSLARSYSEGRERKIIDLLVYLKYYCPSSEYSEFIEKVKVALLSLQTEIRANAFDQVRAAIGIKNLAHLDKLCEQPKEIKYNDLGKM